MSRKNVRIENLRIRVPKGFGADGARRLAAALGGELARELARTASRHDGAGRIERLDAGKIKNPGREADLSGEIARRVAALVGGAKKNR